jgi:hypothetical protein
VGLDSSGFPLESNLRVSDVLHVPKVHGPVIGALPVAVVYVLVGRWRLPFPGLDHAVLVLVAVGGVLQSDVTRGGYGASGSDDDLVFDEGEFHIILCLNLLIFANSSDMSLRKNSQGISGAHTGQRTPILASSIQQWKQV